MAVCLAAVAGTFACNEVLGIRDPEDQIWDGGALEGGEFTSSTTNGSVSSAALIQDGAAPGSAGTWANWPMPNPPSTGLPNPQTYDTSMPGIVADKVTGLEWQMTVDSNTHDWSDAMSYCSSVTLAGGGWRLPTRIELVSILDYTAISPAIDTNAFPGTPPGGYWSSSQFAGLGSSAWVVSFGFGTSLVFNDLVSSKYDVRCVR
ncbi:MAG: DUF1566 domain-containing protein [Polyangiaceae bacterium]